jgi:hypothetical protein
MTKQIYKEYEQRGRLDRWAVSVVTSAPSGVAFLFHLLKRYHNEKTTNPQRCQVR